MSDTTTKATYITLLPKAQQNEISLLVSSSLADLDLSSDELDQAFDNAMSGRVCDLSELDRYGEILALLHISGIQSFGEVQMPVTYHGSSPVVDFGDWLNANDYDDEDYDDMLIDNFLDFCNDWGLEQCEF